MDNADDDGHFELELSCFLDTPEPTPAPTDSPTFVPTSLPTPIPTPSACDVTNVSCGMVITGDSSFYGDSVGHSAGDINYR